MSIFGSILSKIFPSTHPAVVANAAEAQQAPTPLAPNTPMVDVQAVLSGMATQRGEKLNWQSSIVDLMKLLGLESSLGARKSLASELGYKGDTADSSTMNIWLHKQVMEKLAANGGRVPADLLH